MRFPWRSFLFPAALLTLVALGATVGAVVIGRRELVSALTRQAAAQLEATLATAARSSGGWCQGTADTASPLTLEAFRPDGQALCSPTRLAPSVADDLTPPRPDQAFWFRAEAPGLAGAWRASRILPESGLVLHARMATPGLIESLRGFEKRSLRFGALSMAIFLFGLAWATRGIVLPLRRLLARSVDPAPAGPGGNDRADASLAEAGPGEWSDLEQSIDAIRKDLETQAERLDSEREELSAVMSAISDAILAVDPSGVPLFYNTKFALLLAASDPALAERLRSRSVRHWELFRTPEILEAFRSALERGQPGAARALLLESGEGTKRFFSISVAPLRRPDGRVYGAVGIFHDVTDLKSAEQIRIDFVANVSHELRTPLTSIKGYTDTMLVDARAGHAPEPKFLEIIARNTDRLMNLINDLLDLSSLESADRLQKATVSTEEITQRILRQLEPGIESRRQRVHTAFEAPVVHADPRRLEQVLVNLLDNASKYSPAGGTLEVAWRIDRTNAPGDVVLSVRDNGPGIPPEHHARLFERFYRVDKARSREQGGTGLGLAIVKHILQRHDGAVWVESQVGAGSTFYCRFPAG